MKPFLRWAGGKYSQLPVILHHLPKGKRLLEPFVGAGSVFLNAGFDQVSINDVNPDLINLYNIMNHQGARVIQEGQMLCEWVTDLESYNRVRDRLNSVDYSNYSKAVFFLVLNHTCFNGLCRYNQDGLFNVPWGKIKKPSLPVKALQEYIDSGLKPELFCTDFASHMALCREGDVIFCDPPYEPRPGKDGFTTYSGKKFDFNEQRRLVLSAVNARDKGVPTVITNSGVPKIIDLYQSAGFEIHDLPARRSISAKGDTREEVNDIIAILK